MRYISGMHFDRLINLLEIVAVAGRPVAVAEIHKATGLPRPTCYRLIQTLCGQRCSALLCTLVEGLQQRL